MNAVLPKDVSDPYSVQTRLVSKDPTVLSTEIDNHHSRFFHYHGILTMFKEKAQRAYSYIII